jgi:hypothetical protein
VGEKGKRKKGDKGYKIAAWLRLFAFSPALIIKFTMGLP